jgi:hypothetical protein
MERQRSSSLRDDRLRALVRSHSAARADLVPVPQRRLQAHPLDAPPGPEWKPTGERFVDPTSGETLDVWFHEPSGERAYVRSRNQGR